MTETRPTSEQLRFVSTQTGEHVLDVYLEASERGGRTLPDLLADLFTTSGQFNSSMIQFRVNPATSFLQVRAGVFTNANDGWLDIPDGRIFRQRGVYATGAAYERLDIVTLSNSTFVCTTAHTASAASPDPARFSTILDGTALNTATSSAQTSATNAAASAASAATSATTATNQATTATTQAGNASASATAAANSASAAQTSATNAANSATTATNQATTATNQATAAQTSATNSANSASAAAASQTAAANSASAASTSATNAAASASAASTSASNAASSATAAAGSASAASTSATNAANSATAAANSQSAAASSQSAAATSASNASNSATAAEAARVAAELALDSFDDRYLGAKASAPTLDNDGNALQVGALYWDTALNVLRFWSGSGWTSIQPGLTQIDGDVRYLRQTGGTLTGALAVISGTAAAPAIAPSGDSNTGIQFPAADTIAFVEGGVEAMRIDASGNVGIGTSAPGYRLSAYVNSVAADVDVAQVVSDANPSGTSTTRLRLEKGGGFGGSIGGYISQGVGSGLVLSTLSGGTRADQMWLTSIGNVGIGTSAPGYKADVAFSGDNGLRIRSSNLGAFLVFENVTGAVVANSSNTPMVFTTNNTERMRIDASGNVGIGTSTPGSVDSRLAVAGNFSLVTTGNKFYPYYFGATNHCYISSSAGGDMTFGTGTGGVLDRMVITPSGNVGINVPAPSGRLHVSGVSRLDGTIESALSPFVYSWDGGASGQVRSGLLLDGFGQSLQLYTAQAERFRIGPVGQIGVGGANYGSSGQVLTSNGASSAPSWQSISGALGYTPVNRAGDTLTGAIAVSTTASTPVRAIVPGNALFGKALLVEAGGPSGDGPQIHFHKPGVRQWGLGIKNGSGEGDHFTINVDGSQASWGSQTFLLAPGGQVWTSNYGWLHQFFFHTTANCAHNNGTGDGTINCYYTGSNCFGSYVSGRQHEILDNGSQIQLRSVNWITLTSNCNCNC